MLSEAGKEEEGVQVNVETSQSRRDSTDPNAGGPRQSGRGPGRHGVPPHVQTHEPAFRRAEGEVWEAEDCWCALGTASHLLLSRARV